MATIDASIPLGVKPFQMESPVNQLAKIMQLQNFQQENQLGKMKMDEAQRGVQEMNALRGVLGQQGFSWDNDAHRNAAFAAAPLKAEPLYKAHTEGKTAKVNFDEKTFKLAKERQDVYQREAGALYNDPELSKDKVLARVVAMTQTGVLTPEFAQAVTANLPDDPTALRGELLKAIKAQLSPEQMLTVFAPKPKQVDNGQQISFVDENPNSPTFGKPVMGPAVQKVATPDAQLSATTSTENNKRSVGASLANAAATREIANATRDAAKITGNQNTEMKLADDYRAQSKSFKETADAYKQINSVLDKATTSPAATLAGATKFMKMIDPGSVVRESELGMALAATGVFDRAANYFNTLASGRVLTPAQVKDFKAITKQINDAASSQQKLIDNHFASVAKQYGLRPEMVVQDYGQNTKEPTAPAGGVPEMSAIDAELARRQGRTTR